MHKKQVNRVGAFPSVPEAIRKRDLVYRLSSYTLWNGRIVEIRPLIL
jgi:hypothetical protein